MNLVRRRPEWNVYIKRPNYTTETLSYEFVKEWTTTGGSTTTVTFTSSANKASRSINTYTDLIGYEFSTSLKSVSNPFTLKLVPTLDSNNQTWKDKIKKRDIIFIEEFGKIRYIGIVNERSYSSSMTNGKPIRSIEIKGTSIGGILETFNLPMNIYLWFNKGSDADIANTAFVNALNSKIDSGNDLSNIFKLIQDGFFEVNFGSSVSSTGFKTVIDKFYELETSNLEVFYPMNLKPFQQDANTLWSIYRQILPLPIYEIFGKYVDDKYKLICREAPFDYSDWVNLKLHTIDPTTLISQNLSDSDNEVFTHYYSALPNSAFSQNEVYADVALNEVSLFDDDKLPIYGYKELEANFPFYDIDVGREAEVKQQLKQNSARMYAWYRNNIDFQSGDITLMSVPDEENEYPEIGERFQYLEGDSNTIQFYIESVVRRMSYPESMSSTYSVTRGFVYSKSSQSVTIDGTTVQSPQLKAIENLGQKLFRVEKEEGATDV